MTKTVTLNLTLEELAQGHFTGALFWCMILIQMKSKMTETIQTLKEDIAILQEKLRKLEEQDPEMLLLRQGNIDIVDYDGKKYFRIEYTDSFADTYSWYVRRVGEDAIRPVRDVNVYAPLEELYQKEVVKQKDDYPYNPHKKYTPEETAQSLKETAQSLKEAFVKAQQTENWKETQKLIDEEDNDKNFKNSLDLIKEWGEKNKPPTLKELLWEWWEDIFTVDADLDADASIDGLVDRIDKKFIPPSSEKNGYEWEKCLKMMREKLR